MFLGREDDDHWDRWKVLHLWQGFKHNPMQCRVITTCKSMPYVRITIIYPYYFYLFLEILIWRQLDISVYSPISSSSIYSFCTDWRAFMTPFMWKKSMSMEKKILKVPPSERVEDAYKLKLCPFRNVASHKKTSVSSYLNWFSRNQLAIIKWI